MNPNVLLFSITMTLVVLLASGCKDDHDEHSGHDHHLDAHQSHDNSQDHDDHDDDDGHNHDHDAHTTHHSEDDHDDHADAKSDSHDEHGHDDEEHVDEVTLTPEAIKRWDIRAEPLRRHVLTEMLTVPARVSFNTEAIAHIGSVVSGRVSQIKVRVGDHVNAGDVLLVIVSPKLGQTQSEYLQKRSAIATTEATVKVAKSLYDRAKALYDESQGISLSEVQIREAELRAAEGEQIAARSALAAAENAMHLLGLDQKAIDSLGKTGQIDPNYVVRAPFDGQIIDREATPGEAVGPDRDALLVLADLSILWVIADVPETSIGNIVVGAKATVTVPAFRDRTFEGEVTYLGMQLNTATRTIPVRIEVQDAASILRPGMFAQAEMMAGDVLGKPVAAIPEVAVQNVEGDTCVFVPVKGEPNTFAKRVVQIGPPIGRMVWVWSGLREGEPYVAQGSFILKADLGKAGAAHEH